MAGTDVRWLAQVVPVEQRGELRAFASLDDLERIAADDPAEVTSVLGQLRTAYESMGEDPAVVYVIESRRSLDL